MAKHIVLTSALLLLFVIGMLPLLSMLFKSVYTDGHFSLAAYGTFSSHQWTLMKHSMLLSSLVTVLSVAVGMPLGILLEKTDMPFRRFFTLLFVTPLLIPTYILAVSWSDLLGRNGLAASVLGSDITHTTAHYLFGLPGCIAVLFSIFLAIPMLLTMIFLRTVDPRLEEAGRLVTGWYGVMKGITLPLILPGVALSAILVFLLSFGEFSVPDFLRYDVFPVESFTQFSAFYHFKAATAAALPLAAVTAVLLLIEARFLHNRTYQLRPFAAAKRSPVIELGASRPWLLAGVSALGAVIVIVPMLVLLVQSAGIKIYIEALHRAADALTRSILYAAIGATFLTLLGFLTGYLIQKKALRYWRAVDSMTLFLFALPGTVIGIGLIGLWNTPWTNLIYGTPVIILFGYLARYTALTSRICVTQLTQIPPSMEEAAQVAGARWCRTMVFIITPLAKHGLFAAWIVGYIFSLRDTAITMLVYPAGHDTLPVRIFTLMANGSPDLIAALCVIMITATLLPAGALWMLWAKKERG